MIALLLAGSLSLSPSAWGAQPVYDVGADFDTQLLDEVVSAPHLLTPPAFSCSTVLPSSTFRGQRNVIPDNPIWIDLAPQVLQKNRALVKRCLESAGPLPIVVSTNSVDLCKLPKQTEGDSVHYTIRKISGRVEVTLPVLFDPLVDKKGVTVSDNSHRTILHAIRSCIPQIQGAWKNFGIDLKIPIADPKTSQKKLATLNRIKVVNDLGRSNSSRIYFKGQAQDSTNLCQLLTHELGHRLGLTDEYCDKDCPDRKTEADVLEKPTAIMSAENAPGATFYPRDLARVLHPLCDVNALAQKSEDSLYAIRKHGIAKQKAKRQLEVNAVYAQDKASCEKDFQSFEKIRSECLEDRAKFPGVTPETLLNHNKPELTEMVEKKYPGIGDYWRAHTANFYTCFLKVSPWHDPGAYKVTCLGNARANRAARLK